MTLYDLLTRGLALARELYFRDIQAVGMDNIPTEGPVIFAANHPNSIMDTVLLATQTPRRIHYMARSGLFKNPVVAAVFRACGVIPLYRAQDGGDMSQNESSFEAAFELLGRGDCLGIFPEGQNSHERRVLELKTGVARIALGAEARADYQLGVVVIPVGLNFERRDQFLTSVLMRFGEPIPAARWAEQHRESPREAARAMTDAVQDALREQATHIDDDRAAALAELMVQIASGELLTQLADEGISEARARSALGRLQQLVIARIKAPSGEREALEQRFRLRQVCADALMYHEAHHAAEAQRVRQAAARYQDHLAQVRLRHSFADRHPVMLSTRKEAIKLTAYALGLGLPAAWGLMHNAPPYLLTWLAARRAPDEAMRAITGFLVGMLLFGVWYAGIGAWLHWISGERWLVVIPYVLMMPVTGYLTLRYRRQLAIYRDRILVRTLMRTERALVEALTRERDALIERFEQVLTRYLDAVEAGALGEDQDAALSRYLAPAPDAGLSGQGAARGLESGPDPS